MYRDKSPHRWENSKVNEFYRSLQHGKADVLRMEIPDLFHTL